MRIAGLSGCATRVLSVAQMLRHRLSMTDYCVILRRSRTGQFPARGRKSEALNLKSETELSEKTKPMLKWVK